MTSAALRLEQRFAAGDSGVVDGKHVSWPRRRLQHGYFLLQRLKPVEIRGIVIVKNHRRKRWDRRNWALRTEFSEHAEYLTRVPAERVDVEPVLDVTRPLGVILLRRIPQKRITDRRVGDREILRQSEPADGDTIKNHVERI